MNFTFLKAIAKDNPALARTLEIGIIAALLYTVGALIEGDTWNYHAFLVAFLTPLMAFLGKYRRDLEKSNEK